MIVARTKVRLAQQRALKAHCPHRVKISEFATLAGVNKNMAARQKRERCVYCRSSENLTRDHIPPKSFFPPPRPSNLITVPCCRECHGEYTENDAYLRNYLIFSSQCRWHRAARQLHESGLRSLQDPNAGELSNPLFNTGNQSWPGNLVPSLPYDYGVTVAPDHERIEDVIERIVVGLFWIENDKYLPSDYSVDVAGTNELNNRYWSIQESIRRLKNEEESVNIGDGVFQYWWSRAEDAPPEETHCSDWLLQFYEGTTFLCRVSRFQESLNPSHEESIALPGYLNR